MVSDITLPKANHHHQSLNQTICRNIMSIKLFNNNNCLIILISFRYYHH